MPAWAGGTQRRRSAAARRPAAGALVKHLLMAVCASRSGMGMERWHACIAGAGVCGVSGQPQCGYSQFGVEGAGLDV